MLSLLDRGGVGVRLCSVWLRSAHMDQASIQIMLSLLDRGVGVGYAVSGCGLSTWPPPGLLIIHLFI